MALSKVLAELSEQTGNQVADRRQAKTDPKLNLSLQNTTFWPALEAIAKAAGCGISTYQDDGQIALVAAPARALPTVYQGIFRIMVKRRSVTRDDETGTHTCTISLDVAWEPRYQPLYLDIGPMRATFTTDAQGVELRTKIAGQGKVSVAGRSAHVIDVRLPAPKRAAAGIRALEGQFELTGAGKMLTFTFPNLIVAGKGGDVGQRQSVDGVQLSLAHFKTASKRWSVQVTIDNPSGNPVFESYQSWLGNNRIALEKGVGPDRKLWLPQPGDELVERESASQARILYSFRVPPKYNPGVPADWTLVYRTPGPIVTIGVPFVFKDLPLP